MGDYERVDEETVRLVESDTLLFIGDLVEYEDNREYEVIGFDGDFVEFKFVGDGHTDITKDETGNDLLSVWDLQFKKGKYSKF